MARRSDSNTSERSPCVQVVPASRADFDLDGDVDEGNYATFAGCMTGPMSGPPTKGCEPADLDGDTDVDLNDAAMFIFEFTGE
jgi:hypothetical protein